jgi:hypothetical protein
MRVRIEPLYDGGPYLYVNYKQADRISKYLKKKYERREREGMKTKFNSKYFSTLRTVNNKCIIVI